MTSLFASIWAKAQFYVAAAGAIILAVTVAFLRGRAAGSAEVAHTISKETQKINEKFQRIQGQRPDFNGAISRLRDRSRKK